ncbi:MAG: VWA domain-containing protein, partial [Myxococcales bacterium]|nr:VWA domain-containing protein [Myxococcales bacterium]
MLRDWFDAAGEFNAARWVLLSSWPTWALVLVALVALGVFALAWQNTRPLAPRRRRLLLALRGGTLLALAVLFIQPGVRLEHVTRVRNHLVVLVDASRSMGLPGATTPTRLEAVRALFERQAAVLDRWREDHQVDLFAFADHARPVPDLNAVHAEGDATRILSALDDVAARFSPEDLAAVVVVSDGADNGALGEVTADAPPPPAVATAAARLGVPLHAVFTGPEKPPKDVAITDVAYDDFAFVRNAVSVEAEITVTGYQDLILPVTLRRDDVVLGTRMLQTRSGETVHHFEFEFVPDKTGKAVFTLEVEPGPGERITANNRRQFVIRIIRDKIRVLQVVGRPSWDERFLRKLLKKNPNVDLISFFILRTGASISVARRDELSLIPFPTQELFEEQLGSFDLIIFQNFTYRGYHMRQYLPLIRDYVENGGGFVMIGGDLSYASGGYADTPIAEFLPVGLPQDREGLIDTGRFRPTLTEAGRHHPITLLNVVPEENEKAWGGLPELSGINRTTGLRDGAAALLVHPSAQAGGAPAPVVAAWPFGEGRVLAVTTDSTWNWDFLAAGEGGDNRHYYRFWGNAIRWLIRDPALKPVRVEADRDRYPLGAAATLITRVVGRDYAPAADVEVRLDFERSVLQTDGSVQHEAAEPIIGRTDEAGELIARFVPPTDGAWRVIAHADVGGGAMEDDDVFV